MKVGSESATVIWNDSLLLFPALSVAEQLTVVVPNANPEPDDGAHETGTEPSTASVALAENDTGVDAPVALTLMFDGTDTTGGVTSATVTWNDPLPVFPALSVAEQLTVVVPNANPEPDDGEHDTGTGPFTLSVALAENDTGVDAPVALTLMFDGTDSTGPVVSATVTLNESVSSTVLVESDAEHVTVAVPIANVEPEAGSQSTVSGLSLASTAVGAE